MRNKKIYSSLTSRIVGRFGFNIVGFYLGFIAAR